MTIPRTGHLATYTEQGDGIYLVSCDKCPHRERGPMTRNEAHSKAFRHTEQAEG